MSFLRLSGYFTCLIISNITLIEALFVGQHKCPFSSQQIYSPAKGTCVSLVSGPCTIIEETASMSNSSRIRFLNDSGNFTETKIKSTSFEITSCIAGAQCVQFGLHGYCMCRPEFRANLERKCVLNYGDPCDDTSTELRCDERKSLQCDNGLCRCQDNMHVYNHDIGMCLGLVGAFCKRQRSLFWERNTDDFRGQDKAWALGCIRGAICVVPLGEEFGNGVCACIPHLYLETSERLCELHPNPVISNSSDISTGEEESEKGFVYYLLMATGMVLALLLLAVCCGVVDEKIKAYLSTR